MKFQPEIYYLLWLLSIRDVVVVEGNDAIKSSIALLLLLFTFANTSPLEYATLKLSLTTKSPFETWYAAFIFLIYLQKIKMSNFYKLKTN